MQKIAAVKIHFYEHNTSVGVNFKKITVQKQIDNTSDGELAVTMFTINI